MSYLDTGIWGTFYMRLQARIVVVIVQHNRRTQAFSTCQRGSWARSSCNNKLAQAALKNFVQLRKNQHQCLRSGKMVGDSPKLPTLRVSLELLWPQKSWASNFMSMSWGLIIRASLGGMTAPVQLAYLQDSFAWGHIAQGRCPSQCRI